MKVLGAPIPFAGAQLSETRHVCAFFRSNEEKYRVLLPFIKDGFERGDKAIHVVHPEQSSDHLARLAAAGIDAAAAQQSGQFELRTSTETYLRDGHFDQEQMLQVFEQLASGNGKGKFPLSRIDTVIDVMRTHPMVVIGGILQQNPFFVPPEEFLRELRARRG